MGFKDQLSASSRQVVNNTPPPGNVPETTFYIYEAGGQRARKVTEGQNGARKNERFYLGGFDVYREFDAGTSVKLERETLHVMDDKQRIALVETQTSQKPVQRYQLGNHLGSASLELDEAGALLSYEEYSPYGNTAYQARSAAEVSLKRYRYTGKERDEENGFTYHGARYYAPWLGRWVSIDPSPYTQGENRYLYARSNPVSYVDPDGKDPSLAGTTTLSVEEERVAPSRNKELYVRAFENWQNALAMHEAGNAAYWKQEYESLKGESRREFYKNYAKAILAYYVIGIASAAGGVISAAGAEALGGGALVQSTVGGIGGNLALEGTQHVLGIFGGYDRNISGEQISAWTYFKAGALGGLSGFGFGLAGKILQPKIPALTEISGELNAKFLPNPQIPNEPSVIVSELAKGKPANLGGEGELAGYVDVNELKGGNLLTAEQISAKNPTGFLLKADIRALPFASGSVPGIRANRLPGTFLGRYSTEVASEIARVLAPGHRALISSSSPVFAPGNEVRNVFEQFGFSFTGPFGAILSK